MTSKEFRKKSRTEMARKGTSSVKVGRYNVTSHAQNRMVQRDIPNEAMIKNLCKKAEVISPVKIDSKGRKSYERHNRETTTYINPTNNNVISIHVLNDKVARRNGITKVIMKTQSEIEKEIKKTSRTVNKKVRTQSSSKSVPSSTSKKSMKSSGVKIKVRR